MTSKFVGEVFGVRVHHNPDIPDGLVQMRYHAVDGKLKLTTFEVQPDGTVEAVHTVELDE